MSGSAPVCISRLTDDSVVKVYFAIVSSRLPTCTFIAEPQVAGGQAGDEILAVNGLRFDNVSHADAVLFFKRVRGPVEAILARRRAGTRSTRRTRLFLATLFL